MKIAKLGWLFISFLILSGCTAHLKLPDNYMANAQPLTNIKPPEQGMSQIVFARNQTLGWAVASALFEIIDEKPVFIGILANERKIIYPVKPGKHTFMVTSEAADFLVVENMEVDKTYYSLVTSRMGTWTARFTPQPVKADGTTKYNTESRDFNVWFGDSLLATNSEMSEHWYLESKERVDALYQEWWPQWTMKPAEDKARATLKATDGVSF